MNRPLDSLHLHLKLLKLLLQMDNLSKTSKLLLQVDNLSKTSRWACSLHQKTGVEEKRGQPRPFGWLTSTEHCCQAVWEAAEQDGGDDGDGEGEGGEGGDEGAEDPAGAGALHLGTGSDWKSYQVGPWLKMSANLS